MNKHNTTSVDFYWQKFVNNEMTEESFSFIYNALVDELYSYGISLGFRNDLCKDALQDTFYKIYIIKQKLTKVENIKAYIFRIFRNRLIDIHNETNATVNFSLSDNEIVSQVTVLENLMIQEEAEKLKNKIAGLLSNLTPRQREAIYLRYMQELSYDEIATILDVNSESARKLVYRAIDNLRNNKLTLFDIFLLTILFHRTDFLLSC